MREALTQLIRDLDPEIQELVATIISLEREHQDMQKPRGVVQTIRDEIEKYARASLQREETKE